MILIKKPQVWDGTQAAYPNALYKHSLCDEPWEFHTSTIFYKVN